MLICFLLHGRNLFDGFGKFQTPCTHCNLLSSINSSVPIIINLERRCAKFIWSRLNNDNSIVKTIANRPSAVVYQNLEIIIDISVISIN